MASVAATVASLGIKDATLFGRDTTKGHHVSTSKAMPTDDLLQQESAAKLIRELALRPPAKGMASVKAATEVFAANVPGTDEPDAMAGVAGQPAKGVHTR